MNPLLPLNASAPLRGGHQPPSPPHTHTLLRRQVEAVMRDKAQLQRANDALMRENEQLQELVGYLSGSAFERADGASLTFAAGVTPKAGLLGASGTGVFIPHTSAVTPVTLQHRAGSSVRGQLATSRGGQRSAAKARQRIRGSASASDHCGATAMDLEQRNCNGSTAVLRCYNGSGTGGPASFAPCKRVRPAYLTALFPSPSSPNTPPLSGVLPVSRASRTGVGSRLQGLTRAWGAE
eukprot:75766-Chlamydomonas_euryale.AAC.3